MAVYRITRFTSVNIDRVIEKTAGMRNLLESIGAEFVDVVSDGRGNGMVIAKYRDSRTMEAATSTAQKVFSKQIEEFKKRKTEVIGVSIDSKFSHLAWRNTDRKQGGLGEIAYPLVADMSKSISKDYDVF